MDAQFINSGCLTFTTLLIYYGSPKEKTVAHLCVTYLQVIGNTSALPPLRGLWDVKNSQDCK